MNCLYFIYTLFTPILLEANNFEQMFHSLTGLNVRMILTWIFPFLLRILEGFSNS